MQAMQAEIIAGLEKDCEEYEKIITKLEQENERLNKHIKRQDIKIVSFQDKLKPDYLKQDTA